MQKPCENAGPVAELSGSRYLLQLIAGYVPRPLQVLQNLIGVIQYVIRYIGKLLFHERRRILQTFHELVRSLVGVDQIKQRSGQLPSPLPGSPSSVSPGQPW